MSGLRTVGRDDVGEIGEANGLRFYLTPCCRADATGVQVTESNPAGIACRACYRPIDPALGGVPPAAEVERGLSPMARVQAASGVPGLG